MALKGNTTWCGYTGKVLHVDLSRGATSEVDLDLEQTKQFIGGAGLGGKLLYDSYVEGVDALDGRTPWILMTGPLTGTPLAGSVNFSLMTKNPVNGFASCTNANGRFGRCLKFAGYDGIVLEGAAPDLVYVYIEHGRVEVRDARDLAGKDVYETPALLQERHGNGISVGCIGPAGEALVRFAGVLFDREHSASKGGAGAVLGSKRVKAIVVNAPDGKVRVHDPDKMKPVLARWNEIDHDLGMARIVSKQGMRGNFPWDYERGIVPVKNLTTNDFPEHQRYNFDAFGRGFEIKKNPCPGCDFNHFNRFFFEGEDLKEPSFDTIVGFGPNIGVSDPVRTVRLITLVDRLGLESQESSWTLSLLMECYEAGIVGRKDLDGIELTWGNYDAASALLRKIALREGCGAAFADGVYQSALRLGGDALDRAVYVKKGAVPQLMDNRNDWPFTFAEIVSNMSSVETGSNLRGPVPDAQELGIDYPSGLGIAGDQSILAKHHVVTAPRGQVANLVGICFLHGAGRSFMGLIAGALYAVTGLEFDGHSVLTAGTRLINLMRAYNVRNGHTPEHDSVSPRYAGAPDWGLNAGRSLADHLPEALKTYYEEMGWDETGTPRPETLIALGLDYVAKDLERR